MRLFLLPDDGGSPPAPGSAVRLDAAESHHLVKVLRAAPGAPVRLADGRGRFLAGVYAGLREGRAVITLQSARDDPRELQAPRLALACGLVKGRRFEWALEKAVELGAHEIWPLRTARAVIEPGAGRHERWRAIVRAAAKQAARSLVPALHPVTDLDGLLAGRAGAAVCYGEEEARHDRGPGPDAQEAALPAGAAWWVWAVGPEGGWDDAERRRLAGAGARPLRLGPHRLRTETAAAAGLLLLLRRRERLVADGGPAAGGPAA